MSPHRKNTLVVDFSTLPKRPILDQVEEFLKNRIDLDMADVKSIQLHHLENCVFIEMNNASVAPRLQKLHHLKHSFVYEGVDYYVPVYVDGPSTIVKIHDLPPQMPNTAITSHMQQYGKVISIQNDVWKNYFPGVPNGVRILRLRIEKPLPSYVVVDGHRSYICYLKPDTKQQQQQRTSSTTSKKSTTQVGSSTGKANENDDAPSAHPADDSSDDDDGDESDNDDDDGNVQASETAESTGKRRLSTETSSGTTEDNNKPKRSCSQGGQKTDAKNDHEWKVYQTRSRKK